MHFLTDNKYKILGGLLLVVGGWWYYTTFVAGSAGSSDLLTSSSADAPLEGAKLVSALGQLQGVKLDDAIFKNPVFHTLVDFGIEIPPQPIGRPNPFAPLPGGSGGGSSIFLPSGITSGTATK